MAFVAGGSIFNNFPTAKQLVLVFFSYKTLFIKSYSVPMPLGGETWFWAVGADCSSLVTFLATETNNTVFLLLQDVLTPGLIC